MFPISIRHVAAQRVMSIQRRLHAPETESFVQESKALFLARLEGTEPTAPFTLIFHGIVDFETGRARRGAHVLVVNGRNHDGRDQADVEHHERDLNCILPGFGDPDEPSHDDDDLNFRRMGRVRQMAKSLTIGTVGVAWAPAPHCRSIQRTCQSRPGTLPRGWTLSAFRARASGTHGWRLADIPHDQRGSPCRLHVADRVGSGVVTMPVLPRVVPEHDGFIRLAAILD
jgi:hypothetical protein